MCLCSWLCLLHWHSCCFSNLWLYQQSSTAGGTLTYLYNHSKKIQIIPLSWFMEKKTFPSLQGSRLKMVFFCLQYILEVIPVVASFLYNWYLYLTWVFPLCTPLNFYSTAFLRQVLYFLVHYIYLITSASSYLVNSDGQKNNDGVMLQVWIKLVSCRADKVYNLAPPLAATALKWCTHYDIKKLKSNYIIYSVLKQDILHNGYMYFWYSKYI